MRNRVFALEIMYTEELSIPANSSGMIPGSLTVDVAGEITIRQAQLRLHGLPERDPESVDVTNDELTHAVESIIKVFHYLNPVLKASVQVINILGGYVQVDLATAVRARSPAGVEHDFAVSE